MLRINSVNCINNQKVNYQSQPSFKGEERSQINALPEVSPDFSVKKPTSFVKTGVVNLPNDFKAHFLIYNNGL